MCIYSFSLDFRFESVSSRAALQLGGSATPPTRKREVILCYIYAAMHTKKVVILVKLCFMIGDSTGILTAAQSYSIWFQCRDNIITVSPYKSYRMRALAARRKPHSLSDSPSGSSFNALSLSLGNYLYLYRAYIYLRVLRFSLPFYMLLHYIHYMQNAQRASREKLGKRSSSARARFLLNFVTSSIYTRIYHASWKSF